MGLVLYPWQEELAFDLNTLRKNLPNGVLIYGPRGIGTFEFVHEFAKSLLCQNPRPDGSSCGSCKGCILAKTKNHPDIRYIVSEAEALPRDIPFTPPENASTERKNLYREILIHQPRAIADFLTMNSHEGGVRVILVYPADQIRAEAAASLLKNLEEPPARTVFLLVADEIDQVLPTIRSRCRLIRARAPSREEALNWLKTQDVTDPEEKLTEAAGMPLSVFEVDERLTLSSENRLKLLDFLRKGKMSNSAQALSICTKEIALPGASKLFSRWGWDLASVREGGTARYFPQYEADLRRICEGATREGLYMWINTVRDVVRASGHTLNARLIIEQVLLSYLRCIK